MEAFSHLLKELDESTRSLVQSLFKRECESFERERESFNRELASLRDSFQKERDSFQKERDSFQKERESFERELASLRDSFQKERDSFQKERDSFQKEREGFERERGPLNSTIELLTERATEMEKEKERVVEELMLRIDKLEGRLDVRSVLESIASEVRKQEQEDDMSTTAALRSIAYNNKGFVEYLATVSEGCKMPLLSLQQAGAQVYGILSSGIHLGVTAGGNSEAASSNSSSSSYGVTLRPMESVPTKAMVYYLTALFKWFDRKFGFYAGSFDLKDSPEALLSVPSPPRRMNRHIGGSSRGSQSQSSHGSAGGSPPKEDAGSQALSSSQHASKRERGESVDSLGRNVRPRPDEGNSEASSSGSGQ